MTHRGDKLRDQVRAQLVPPLIAGHLENLRDLRDQSPEKSSEKPSEPEKQEEPSGLDLHLLRRFRSQTDLGDTREARDAPRAEMDHLRSLSESKPRAGSASASGSGSPVSRQQSRRWPEELVSPRVNEIPKRISATQLLQSPNQQPQQMQQGQPGPFPQAVVESKTELSLNGDTLDLLMAPGDVLLMRGSGRISDIGNAGGFMGHVLVVTATPQMVRANTADALQLSSVWPHEAKALWRVGTVESTRRESGLYECESLLFVDRSRQLLLIGEVEKEGDVCNFEPHEVVEIWQSPEAFRGTLRLDLMGTVLQDMRKNQASWSATTAARAAQGLSDFPRHRLAKRFAKRFAPGKITTDFTFKHGGDILGISSGDLTACAVDAADKALLPATFKAMEDLMQVGPRDLGALSFAQSIAFSVALPFWGSMMRYYRPRDLLAMGCLLWGMFTLVVSTSSTFITHFVMRLFIGAALAVVMPIGQAMICDLVPEHERGTAFGIMKSVCSVLAEVSTFVTTALARSSMAGTSGWRVIYGVVALMSLITAWLVKSQVPANLSASAPVKGQTWLQEQVRVVRTAAQKPSFCFMVLQGVTGGVPWHAFAFLPFYFQQNGYSDVEAAQILLYGGFGGIISGVLGGVLGDRFHKCWPYSGRCLAAFMSVVLGMVFFFAAPRSKLRPPWLWFWGSTVHDF
eukprot:s4436_g1.t1